MQFNVVIERDEDGRYVAECMDLPGCLSEGETLEEALENISEAILGCVKSRLKLLLEKQPWIEIPACLSRSTKGMIWGWDCCVS
jgi:predicted RNase H-like HicB family nuclease